MAVYLGDNPGFCDKAAQVYGALAYDGFGGCLIVSGKEIKIEELNHSIMEGFEITNYNFHNSGAQPPVPNKAFLQGPVDSTEKADFA